MKSPLLSASNIQIIVAWAPQLYGNSALVFIHAISFTSILSFRWRENSKLHRGGFATDIIKASRRHWENPAESASIHPNLSSVDSSWQDDWSEVCMIKVLLFLNWMRCCFLFLLYFIPCSVCADEPEYLIYTSVSGAVHVPSHKKMRRSRSIAMIKS